MPQTVILPVRLSEVARERATVDWRTDGFYTSTGSSNPAIHYTAAAGSLVWEIGEQVKNIEITILDAAQPGFFFIFFTNASSLLIGTPVTKITLQAASSGGGDTIGGGGDTIGGGGGGGVVTPPSGLAITIGGEVITVLGIPLTL